MELTLAKTLGVEGVEVAVWGCLAGFVADGDWIEPTIPLIGASAGGFVGSMLG